MQPEHTKGKRCKLYYIKRRHVTKLIWS